MVPRLVRNLKIQNFIQHAYTSVNKSFDSNVLLSAKRTPALDSIVLPPLQIEKCLAGYRHSKGRETDFI